MTIVSGSVNLDLAHTVAPGMRCDPIT